MRKIGQSTDPRTGRKQHSIVSSDQTVLQSNNGSVSVSSLQSYGYLLPNNEQKTKPALPISPYLTALLQPTSTKTQSTTAFRPALSRGTVVAQSLPSSKTSLNLVSASSHGPVPKKMLNPVIVNASTKVITSTSYSSSVNSVTKSVAKPTASNSEPLKEFMKRSFLLCQSEDERSAVRSYLTSLIREKTGGDMSRMSEIDWTSIALPDPKRLMSSVARTNPTPIQTPIAIPVQQQQSKPVVQATKKDNLNESAKGGDRKRSKRDSDSDAKSMSAAQLVVDIRPTPLNVLQSKISSIPVDSNIRKSKFGFNKSKLHARPTVFTDNDADYNDNATAIIGTSSTILKEYSRLQGSAIASTVRSELVLVRALDCVLLKWRAYRDRVNRMNKDNTESSDDVEDSNDQNVEEFVKWQKKVKSSATMDQQESKNDDSVDYAYIWSQLKSIRQDLMVQRIQNDFTVTVYESHARICLIEGDLNEFNQCQTQLKRLYKTSSRGSFDEFSAYYVLYFIFQQNTANFNGNTSELHAIMKACLTDARSHPCTMHALESRQALSEGSYKRFFAHYMTTPNLGKHILDAFIDDCRIEAIRKILCSYKPDISTQFITRQLGFASIDDSVSFLSSVGIQFSDSESTMIDTKNSRIDLSSFDN